jgi:hypothetical protein
MLDRVDKPITASETTKNVWSTIAADARSSAALRAGKLAESGTQAFAGLARGYGGLPEITVHQAGFSIAPCTPPGKDPLQDPANPKSPNYDADNYGPKPAGKTPLIPKNDGVINPGELEIRKKLGPLYEPAYLPYTGVCKDPPPEKDPSEIPIS